jgi:hypothetical protein
MASKGVDLRIGLDLVAHARNAASDVFFLVSGDDDLTEAVEEAQVHGVQVVVLAVPTDQGKPHGVSRHLVLAADELDQIDGAAIDDAVLKVEVPRRAQSQVIPTPVTPGDDGTVTGASRSAPSPLDVAAKTRDFSPAVAPVATLAYSSSTGGASQVRPDYEADEVDEQLVDEVVDRVLASFRKTASREDLIGLQRARPSIPRDIDRALLLDASDAMDVYDLSEPTRYRLRARFWERYDAN